MTEKSEWQFLVDYLKDDTTDFRNAACRSQLMALWTAYCMHNDLDVDTKMYDATLFLNDDDKAFADDVYHGMNIASIDVSAFVSQAKEGDRNDQ